MTAAAIRPTVETKPQHHQPNPQTKSNSYSILSFKRSAHYRIQIMDIW